MYLIFIYKTNCEVLQPNRECSRKILSCAGRGYALLFEYLQYMFYIYKNL